MTNLQQFLEEIEELQEEDEQGQVVVLKSCLQERDTRLINFVLSEVAREWFKAKAETFSGQDEAEKCVETIINNLRIKQ